MRFRAFLLSLAVLVGLGWIVGENPQTALASRQACNPAIATVSGSSNVFGTTKTASGGPGNDVSSFPPIERRDIGPLDVTNGMTYRGGGLWQDNSGNRLQLSISATRNPQTSGSLGGECQSAFLQQSSRHDVAEADPTTITSSTTTVKYTMGYEINNTNGTGSGQTYYLQVATSVTPTSAPVLSAPNLNVTNTCSGTNSVFNLSWSGASSGVTGYALFQNGTQYATVGANVTSSTTGTAAAGASFTYRVEAIYPTGRAASNSVTVTARNCAPVQQAGSVVINPITNITCVSGNPTHPHVTITWTASGTITSNTGTPNTMHLDFGNGTTIPVNPGAAVMDLFNYNIPGLNNGYVYSVRFIFQGGSSNTQTFSINCPSTPAPAAPGPFTLTASVACISSTTVRVTLNWTASANAANGYTSNANHPGATAAYTVISWQGTNVGPEWYGNTDQLTFSNNEPVGAWTTKYFAVRATGPGGSTQATLGSGTTDASIPGSGAAGVRLALSMPDCAPVPGAFTATLVPSCQGTDPIGTFTWSNSSNADTYRIYDANNSAGGLSLLATIGSSAGNSYVLHQLDQHGLQFAIRASNSTGVANGTLTVNGTMPDCSPTPTITQQTPTQGCTNGAPYVALKWTSSSGLTSFTVFRDGTRLEAGTNVTNSALTAAGPEYFFTDLTASPGSHTYKITSGTTESAVQTITVAACPSAPNAPTLTVVAECIGNAPVNRATWTSGAGTNRTVSNYQLARTPNGGAMTLLGTTLTYTDTQITTGTSYVYRVTATNEVGATASNQVTVVAKDCAPANQPPVAVDDTSATKKETAVTIDVLANDSDPDGNLDPATVEVTQNPGHGTVTFNSAHRAVYTPAAGYVGTDTFKYKVCDTAGLCDDATVTVTINETNQPPVAVDDAATTQEGAGVTIDVLANDSDPDNNLDPATVEVTQNPGHGTVTFLPDHKAVYTPAAGFSGTDTFKYKVCDTLGLCDDATVTITVTPKPAAPGQFTLQATALCAGTSSRNVLTWGASGGATSYSVRRGTQTLVASQTATTFTDTTVVAGTSYAYTVVAINDGGTTASNVTNLTASDCAPAATPNQPPQANDDTAATDQDSFVVIPVLANDTDPDGTVVVACTKVVTAPAHGTAVVDTASGNIAYTPATGFNGTDTFVYEICDDKGATDTATVTVTVRPPAPTPGPDNQPPQANDDAAVTPHDTSVTVDILLNDADPDGNLDPTCVKIVNQPGHGTVSVDAQTGRATYTPAADFAGTDTFTYTVCDTDGAVSNTATVSIAVSEAPPAVLATTGIPIIGFFVDLWNKLLTFLHLR